MSETIQIEKILNIVKSKMEAHKEFKDAYNEQLALDFDLFNFFAIGENKVSQILAYFLNPNEAHGQSDKFLKEFLSLFFDEKDGEAINNKYSVFDSKKLHIKCEHIITNERRIDVFMKLGSQYIAIENKIWAKDQENQLADYSNYLNNISHGNYVLFYLNPFGQKPSIASIEEKLLKSLCESKQVKTISYKSEIFALLDRWLLVCKADNVSFFIKNFKQHLSSKFLGVKPHNMTNTLKDLLYKNQPEIATIINAYNELQQNAIKKLEGAGRYLDKMDTVMQGQITLNKVNNFSFEGKRAYKWGLQIGQDKIYIQIIQDKLTLFLSYYTEESTSAEFEQKIIDIKSKQIFSRKSEFDSSVSKDEIIKDFLKYVDIAQDLFSNTDQYSGSN